MIKINRPSVVKYYYNVATFDVCQKLRTPHNTLLFLILTRIKNNY